MTVAVQLTDWPTVAGLGEHASAVEVAVGVNPPIESATFAVPVSPSLLVAVTVNVCEPVLEVSIAPPDGFPL